MQNHFSWMNSRNACRCTYRNTSQCPALILCFYISYICSSSSFQEIKTNRFYFPDGAMFKPFGILYGKQAAHCEHAKIYSGKLGEAKWHASLSFYYPQSVISATSMSTSVLSRGIMDAVRRIWETKEQEFLNESFSLLEKRTFVHGR